MRTLRISTRLAILTLAALPLPVFAEDAPDNAVMAGPELRLAPRLPDGTPPDIADMLATPVTTLEDALRRAYWTTPPLLAQRAAVHGVDYRVAQARSQYGPRLSLSATYGWQRDNFEQPAGGWFAVQGWSSTAAAILTQPLFTFGRNPAAERFALAQRDFQRHVMRASEQQALLDAITAYVGLRRDRMGVTIAADNLGLLERELRDNRARLKGREVTATDVQQVETRVELARAQLFSARDAAATSEATFIRMVSSPAGELSPPMALGLPVSSIEAAYAAAVSRNPVLQAAHARERVSRANRDSVKADLMPRVDLRGRAEYGTVSPYSDDLRQSSLRGEVVLTTPLYESGLRRARLDEAAAANDADWRLIDAALRENRANIADAWNEWQAQGAAIDRLAAAVESARLSYDGALAQERAGLRTTLDVLDLARELLSARSAYNNAQALAYIAKARLLQAMGMLDGSSLLPDERLYDPDTHFRRVRDNGDVPLLTPMVRALDTLSGGNSAARPLRDPAAASTAPGIDLMDETAPTAGQ